jgi:hypothetical protein
MSIKNVDRAPFNRIPEKWAFDPDFGPFIRDIVSQIWQLRNRTGGDSDSVGELENGELFTNNVQGDELSDRIDTLDVGGESNLLEIMDRIESIESESQIPFYDLTEKPLSTTDNTLVRFDGTDAALKASGISVDDSNNISGYGNFTDNATFTGNLTVKKRILGTKGADVTSANDITLGDGNYFDVTGTTQINTIASTSWTEGSIVTLQFDGVVTVKHLTAGAGAQLDLNGAADFVTAAGNHLMLQYASSKWWEISRKV